ASHTVVFAAGGSDNKAPTVSAGNASNTLGDTSVGGTFAGTWKNQGTMTAVPNGGLTLRTGTFINDAGGVWSAAGGTFQVGGTFTGSKLYGISGTLDHATLGAGLTLQIDYATGLTVTNGLTVNGTVLFSASSGSGLTIQGSQTIDGTGSITFGAAGGGGGGAD